MRRPYLEHHISPMSLPEIRCVGTDRPWFWLTAAWEDFSRAPGVSLIYGMVVSLVFMTVTRLLVNLSGYYLAAGLMAGFVLVGPVLAVGLYEVSRRLEAELETAVSDTIHGWRRNFGSTLAMGVILVLLMLSWFMVSMDLTAVLMSDSHMVSLVFGGAPDLATFVFSITWPMVAAFALTGLAAAVVAFLLTAVAVPLLVDHEDMDVISAIATSVTAVTRNWRPMLLWGVMVLVFTGVSVLPLYLGLIVAFPLLAYATWHAYREIIGE